MQSTYSNVISIDKNQGNGSAFSLLIDSIASWLVHLSQINFFLDIVEFERIEKKERQNTAVMSTVHNVDFIATLCL